MADSEDKDTEESESKEQSPDTRTKYCSNCGEKIDEKAEICPECGVRQGTVATAGKDKVVAGILGILLGGLGIHKFYLEDKKMGVLYLCFFWTGIPAIIGFIEGLIYLLQSDEEFKERYG